MKLVHYWQNNQNLTMSLNVEELLDRYKERAEAVKNRSIPPVGGDDRMAFVKQAEIDY